jgi:hypothetical protein
MSSTCAIICRFEHNGEQHEFPGILLRVKQYDPERPFLVALHCLESARDGSLWSAKTPEYCMWASADEVEFIDE